ncbi:hypothetical protein OM076_25880 [Solirubrobacter ginsenosidimutans]|uniref:Uncharacterized protein n=1 Tax=Solirubrobacter ginsenosidimutans TaxID=490573 RepID=A0A9X3S517_9ACTN|nr:hypothetical protein [Solirubrobacter ginsenosidimutans]MDA0163726.1 hypothetical protein [Solirubrobacter ginsenosidimutans]
MRILLATIALLVSPAAAEARTACGRAQTKAIARTADAWLFKSGATLEACTSVHTPPIRLGSAAARWRIAGRHVAVVDRGALTLRDLLLPLSTDRKRLNAKDGTVRGLSVSLTGGAAWIEDHAGGSREVRAASDGQAPVALDAGRGISPAFVHVAASIVSWQKGGSIRVGSFLDERDAPQSWGEEPLGTVGDVELSYATPTVIARYKHGRRVRLGAAYTPDTRDDSAGGIDAIRVSGAAIAVRENATVNGRSASGRLQVFDLARGTSRTPCQALAIWNFVLTTGGSTACAMVVDTLGGTSVNRIVAENAVLDEGDRTVTDLDQRGTELSWRHGDQTRTAALPAAQPAVPLPCGPRAAGTFEISAAARVYVSSGVAKACSTGSRRVSTLGSSARVSSVSLGGRFAAVVRDQTSGQSLHVYDIRTGRLAGRRATAPAIGDVVLAPSGLAVFVDAGRLHDTLGTTYPAADTTGSIDSVQVTGRVVSWVDALDRLHLQEVTGDPTFDVPAADGDLMTRLGITVSLAKGQLLARFGAITLPLGTAACAGLRGCEGITGVGVWGSVIGTFGRAGTFVLHDLASGATTTQSCSVDASTPPIFRC